MKKIYFPILFALALVATSFSSCKKDKETDKDKVLVITNGAQSIHPDGSLTYKAQFVDADGKTTEATGVTWSTSDGGVASVSAAGVVSVAGVGTVTVTATVSDGDNTFTASVPLGIVSPTVFAVVPSAIIWEPSARR